MPWREAVIVYRSHADIPSHKTTRKRKRMEWNGME